MGWSMSQYSSSLERDLRIIACHEYKIHSVLQKECLHLDLKTETEPKNQKTILLLRTEKAPCVFGCHLSRR